VEEHYKIDLKKSEQIFIKQFRECAGFYFFREFKTHELETEEIPDLIEIIELIRNHEKALAKQRQELEIRILKHRMKTLAPNKAI